MMNTTKTSTETSGLLLPLKLIVRSLETDSANNHIIRSKIVQMLEGKLDGVQMIPTEEIPRINELLIKIEPEEPVVVSEVRQIVTKFHPNL